MFTKIVSSLVCWLTCMNKQHVHIHMYYAKQENNSLYTWKELKLLSVEDCKERPEELKVMQHTPVCVWEWLMSEWRESYSANEEKKLLWNFVVHTWQIFNDEYQICAGETYGVHIQQTVNSKRV